MLLHDFAFVLDAQLDDEMVEDRLFEAGCDDATVILQKGAWFVSFDREAPTFKDAVLSAYEDIRSTPYGIKSFEPDYLVSAIEIASRVNQSRASISKYANPEIENGFPAPFKRVQSARPLYDWVEVSKWFVDHHELKKDVYLQALVSRSVNAGVQLNDLGRDIDVPNLVNSVVKNALAA